MTKLLEENHIALPKFAKRWERKQGNGKVEHALGAWIKPNSYFFVSDSHSDISEPKTSIPSLKKFPVSSSKLPPKTSHFHQLLMCLLKALPKSIQIFPFMILKMIYMLIYSLLQSFTHFPNRLMTKRPINPQVHQLEIQKISQFPILSLLYMLILCIVCISLVGKPYHWPSWYWCSICLDFLSPPMV